MDSTVIIRPPSEASSLLLPVTVGCSHNRCTFCGTFTQFQFSVRDIKDITRDIDRVAASYPRRVRRVFLENGDALAAPAPLLAEILRQLRAKFPNLERAGTYATPRAALEKTPEELEELRELGLEIAYLGVETGDEALLKKVKKGATYAQIVAAGRRIMEAGITLSVTVILGLGGAEGSEKHAHATARILTDIDPDYAGALTLMLVPGSELHRDWEEGRFRLISPMQSLRELRTIVAESDFTDCFFTANHASNYLPIRARLPEQKAELLKLLDGVLASGDTSRLRPELYRAL